MEKTDFFKQAKMLAAESGSLYKGSASEREELLWFLEKNKWFGHEETINPEKRTLNVRDAIIAPEYCINSVLEHLRLWFKAYKKPDSEKLEILADFGRDRLPETTNLLVEFVKEREQCGNISSWRLLDFLLYYLPGELREQTENGIDVLAAAMDNEATRDVCNLFSSFYDWMQEKLEFIGWSYKFQKRNTGKNKDAYPFEAFTVMAYCVFNEDHWKQEQMLEKACSSAVYANLWAFVAMHMICALRPSDIVRLPKPDLLQSGDEVRKKLLEGTLENPEVFAQDMQIRLRYNPKKPSKTSQHANVPDLKVFIPESLERSMGIILAVAASYKEDVKPGEPFITADWEAVHASKFFGEDFKRVLDGKGFSSLRANKSYLQGLEVTAGEVYGKPKGYMIVAMARSHKGGIGTLPKMTEVYLKDGNFSGYKPEFIAHELFERGVFGFIPHLLMEVYAGKTYSSLPVAEQTQLIKSIGISPSGIESLVRLTEKALTRAKNVVTELLSRKKDCGQILQMIASGEAVGKQEGCLCAMTACGFGCAFIDRAACIGCRYEVPTKAVMHLLVSEYSRMLTLTNGEDGWRYKKMIKEVILPVISEYLSTFDSPDERKALILLTKGGERI